MYTPLFIVPFKYSNLLQDNAQIGCPLCMTYVSGSLPEDCDTKPVNLRALSEFLNIICQWEPTKAEFLRQPIHDFKYFVKGIFFLSSVLILDFDVIVFEYPVKPLGLATTMRYKHDNTPLPILSSLGLNAQDHRELALLAIRWMPLLTRSFNMPL
jgi:hypothetical protein